MKPALFASAILLGLAAAVPAQVNVDPVAKHSWGENVGWTNWRGEATPGQGVTVGPFVMDGYIWGENVGWISVGDGTPTVAPFYANDDDTDYGVNIDPDGDLHGYAWSENLGWVNFDGGAMATPAQPARILCATPPAMPLARLTGCVWGENVGWINLSELTAGNFVAVDTATTPLLCDMNHDGFSNGGDVQGFVHSLLNGTGDWRDVCSGDQPPTNGAIDLGDVTPFVNCLLN